MDSFGLPEGVQAKIRDIWHSVSEESRLRLQEAKVLVYRDALDMLRGFPGTLPECVDGAFVDGGEGLRVKPVEIDDPDEDEMQLRFCAGDTGDISIHLTTAAELDAYVDRLNRALPFEGVIADVEASLDTEAVHRLDELIFRVIITNVLVCTNPFDRIYLQRMRNLVGVFEEHLVGVMGGEAVMFKLTKRMMEAHRYNLRWFFMFDFISVPGLSLQHSSLAGALVHYEELYEVVARVDSSEFPREIDSQGMSIVTFAMEYDFDIDLIMQEYGDVVFLHAWEEWKEDLESMEDKKISAAEVIDNEYPFLATRGPLRTDVFN